jgi:hypothetical protein
MPVRSAERPKAKRVNFPSRVFSVNPLKIFKRIAGLRSGERIFGLTPYGVRKLFQKAMRVRSPVKIFRIYKVSKDKLRYIVHVMRPDGQYFYEIHNSVNSGISFENVGRFFGPFDSREIKDESLRGKGLGTKALKSYTAQLRSEGGKRSSLVSSVKSALLMLLKKGYKIDRKKVSLPISLLGRKVRNEKELMELLENDETPESLDVEMREALKGQTLFKLPLYKKLKE